MNHPVIELNNLVIDLDGNRFLNSDMNLKPNGVHLIKGRSGTGKSTLLRAIARLHPAESGDIFFKGSKSDSIKPMRWRKKICYLAQTPVMFPGTVLDNLQIPKKFHICESKNFKMDETIGLLEMVDIPENMLKNPAGGLSGGEAARVAVVRALLCEPEVILADEITAPLDEESAVKTIELLIDWMQKGEDHALIVVAHQMEFWKDYISEETTIENFLKKRVN